MSPRHYVACAAISMLPLAGLTACSDSDDARTKPDAVTSTTSATDTPSTLPPTATAAPAADGQLVDAEVYRFHLPSDGVWKSDLKNFTVAYARIGPRAGETIHVSSWAFRQSPTSPETLDDVADVMGVDDRSQGNQSPNVPPLSRGPDRVVQGANGFTAETETRRRDGFKQHVLVLVWGTVHNGQQFALEVDGPPNDPRTREWFEQILSSLEWK